MVVRKKMSKSRKNIIDPLSIIEKYGADTARLFILSDSPPDRDLEWSENGVDGAWKFLRRLWTYFNQKDFSLKTKSNKKDLSEKVLNFKREIHSLIKLTTENYDSFRFNAKTGSLKNLK